MNNVTVLSADDAPQCRTGEANEDGVPLERPIRVFAIVLLAGLVVGVLGLWKVIELIGSLVQLVRGLH